MSGPTIFHEDGEPLFTPERPAIVQIADLLEVVGQVANDAKDAESSAQEADKTLQKIIDIVENLPVNQDAKNNGQRDFLEFHRLHMYQGGTMEYRVTADRFFDVKIPIDASEKLNIKYMKDPHDDFMKLSQFAVMKKVEAFKNSINYGTVSDGAMFTPNTTTNQYTTQVGTKITTTFNGTGIDMQHNSDTRGGMWKVEVDGVFIKNISTHVLAVPASEIYAGQYGRRPIARNLAPGNHTVTLTFLGEDPTYPATTDGTTPTTARGWIRNDSQVAAGSQSDITRSFYQYDLVDTPYMTLLDETSNKEFAFSVKPNGSTLANQWFPEHNNTGTAFANGVGNQTLYVDGKEVNLATVSGYTPFTDLMLVQKLDMKYPGENEPLANMVSAVNINRHGVHIDTTFEFLRDTFIGSGYVNMFPMATMWVRQLTTALGKNIEATKTDGSRDYINEGDNSFSYMGTGSIENKLYYAGMTHRNASETMRLGKPGRLELANVTGATWLEHRNTTLQKLYPQVFNSHVMVAGEKYRFAGSFYAGKVPEARRLISGL